ncbi:MAG: TetR/AcrR family transcriptional regulator [Frankiaceae bacterium]
MATRQAVDPDRRGQSSGRPSQGRVAQRRRTRDAIVAAAKRLLADGRTPSIDEIAAAADVSRRTIYMHFPTLDQLLLDATAGLLSEGAVDALLDPDRHGDDVLARVDGLVRAFVELAPDTLPLGRKIIRLTVDAEQGSDGVRRGYRRRQWIERAVEPLRPRLAGEQFARLVAGLSVVLGWEAMVVLRDVAGLDPAAEERTMRWAARAMVTAMLAEAGEAVDAGEAR